LLGGKLFALRTAVELVLLLSVDFLELFSLFLARSTCEGCFFLRHQKETKKCFPSAESCNFGRSFRGNILDATKPMGLRLPKVEVYIETTETADDGGGNVACAVHFLSGYALLRWECGACANFTPICHSERSEE
jgi:hypothetical protein